MAAHGQVEAEDGVAGLEDGHVGGGVGLRAGVGLHVGVLGREDLFGAIAGEVLDHIGILASAVIAASRIAFGIFVGEDRGSGFEDGAADEVLGGDHLEAFVLAADFGVDGGGDFGVVEGEGAGHAVGHGLIVMDPPGHRAQSTEHRAQNTEHRAQTSVQRIAHRTANLHLPTADRCEAPALRPGRDSKANTGTGHAVGLGLIVMAVIRRGRWWRTWTSPGFGSGEPEAADEAAGWSGSFGRIRDLRMTLSRQRYSWGGRGSGHWTTLNFPLGSRVRMGA